MTGVTQGVGAAELHVDRQEQPDRCCGVITLPSSRNAASTSLAGAMPGPATVAGRSEIGTPRAVNGY